MCIFYSVDSMLADVWLVAGIEQFYLTTNSARFCIKISSGFYCIFACFFSLFPFALFSCVINNMKDIVIVAGILHKKRTFYKKEPLKG